MSSFIERRRRKLPLYRWLILPRIIALGVIVAVIIGAGVEYHAWTITLFFSAFFVYMLTRGSGVAPFFAIVGETIRPTKLGGFFAWRSLVGDGCAVAAGLLVIQPLLRQSTFPTNYASLIVIGTGVLSIGWIAFSFAQEGPQTSQPPRRDLRATIAMGVQELHDSSNYRMLLILRLLFRVNILALAFYVPYGIERLGATVLGGVLVGCMSASRMGSSLLWGRLSQKRGNRLCLIWAGAGFALAPVGVLVAPRLPSLFSVAMPGALVLDLPMLVYIAALAVVGLSMQGNMIGTPSFLIESAPEDRRASYVAFLNAISFPLTLLPAIAGLLVGHEIMSLEMLFAIVAGSGVATVVTASQLREVRAPLSGTASKDA